VRIGIPDLISPSYFPVLAAEHLGCLGARGIDASVELVFPVVDTYAQLRDGGLDFIGGAAHAALYAFDGWRGCRLLGAVSQHMYWFLVVRTDVHGERGDLNAVRGLRIGAAPGPADGLQALLRATGIDPDTDLTIGPVPAAHEGNISFGVSAADALRRGEIDGFWANGMGAEVAVLDGIGRIVVDVRRDPGFDDVRRYTFPVLATTERMVQQDAGLAESVVAAMADAQQILAEDPASATTAAAEVFPPREAGLIARLIERDSPYYDPTITRREFEAVNGFATDLGLLGGSVDPYDEVVVSQFTSESS
jgi:ABC-type nitrate/sulfonate/bicarbonate transport system substrate-binding protein